MSDKLYPNANHMITPSKKLSECKTGWMLLWCDIPRFYGSATDTSLEKRITKTLAIYDNKIVGSAINSQGDRNDVVLRAIYEF